jgi:glycosyltransferase involved in cell wall biosynthesis
MKIALIIMRLETGGAEHDVINLSVGLKQAGHEPVVITSGGRLCEGLRAEGVPVELCPLWVRDPISLRKNGRRLADIAQAYGTEVLNPQGVYPGISGHFASRRLLKQGRAVPNIVTIPMLNRLTRWYYRLGAFALNRVADHVIVESDCERRRLESGGLKRPLTILHNCFPSGRLESVTESRAEIRRRMGWPEDRVVFIMPARFTREKAHDIVVRALARPEMRPLPILVYLAGDGPDLVPVRTLADRLAVSDKIVFGGFRHDMPALYKAADVFLLPSRYESLPLSIREGMAASLPVLATDVGGVAEAVENEASGLLIPPGDPASLAAAMTRLASDAPLRSTLGRRGRQINADKFNYDRWIARTVEVMSAVRDSL